ncbi:hypothetical protein C8F04DRAFT_1257203 [Mycena alexandri]|uniref:Uncharacterized protein n=1 Tax=Mycena alexandri TaxID=1745969 RepID=A0AAD6T2M7_9AGAR|nr:hypothetical protein C8F04DRAFT_1257203 [Mycena alexandri]
MPPLQWDLTPGAHPRCLPHYYPDPTHIHSIHEHNADPALSFFGVICGGPIAVYGSFDQVKKLIWDLPAASYFEAKNWQEVKEKASLHAPHSSNVPAPSSPPPAKIMTWPSQLPHPEFPMAPMHGIPPHLKGEFERISAAYTARFRALGSPELSSPPFREPPASPPSRERPESAASRERPASPPSRERPASPPSRERPASPPSRERPASPPSRERSESPLSHERPAPPLSRERPAPPLSRECPASPPSAGLPAVNRDIAPPQYSHVLEMFRAASPPFVYALSDHHIIFRNRNNAWDLFQARRATRPALEMLVTQSAAELRAFLFYHWANAEELVFSVSTDHIVRGDLDTAFELLQAGDACGEMLVTRDVRKVERFYQ